MIEALKADLQTLSDTVPSLAQHVADVTQSAHALDQAAHELQQEVDAARGEMTFHLVVLRNALPELAGQADTSEQQIEAARTGITAAWSDSAQVLESEGERVANAVDELNGAAHDLGGVLAEAATKIDHFQAAGEAALAQLEQGAHEADQRIHAALDALAIEIATLQTAVATVKQGLATDSSALWSRIGDTNAQAEAATSHALEALREQTAARKDALHRAVDTVAQDVMDAVDAADGQIEHAITAPLAEGETAVGAELVQLGDEAGKQEQALIDNGRVLEGAVGDAQKKAEPIPADLESIRQALHQLGVQS